MPTDYGDFRLDVEVSCAGYTPYLGKGLSFHKGDELKIYLSPDPGKPTLKSASFNGDHDYYCDIFKTAYDTFYSPLNDDTFDLEVITTAPAKVTVKYTDVKGNACSEEKNATTDNKCIVTFSKKWKQTIKPGTSVSVVIAGVETKLKLNVSRGVVDSPAQDFMGIFDTAFGSGITIKAPGNIPILSNMTLNISIPWEELLGKKLPVIPRVLLNLDGSYGLYLSGVAESPLFFDKIVKKWKSQDMKQLQQAMQNVEKTAKNKIDMIQQMMQPPGTPGFKKLFMFGTEINVGLFLCIIARYKTDNGWKADLDDYQVNIRIQVGFILTFSMQFRWYVCPSPMISLFIGVDLSLAAGFNFDILKEKSNGKTKSKFLSDVSGFTITLRIQITVGLTLDLAVVSVTLGGYAYIRIAFTVSFKKKNVDFAVYAGMGIFIEVRIVFLRLKFNYNFADIPGLHMDHGEWLLYDSSNKSSAREELPWFTHLLPAARAADEEQEPEEGGKSRAVEDYSALTPQAQPVLQNLSLEADDIHYADIDGQAYAFYIRSAQNGGKSRLTWVNMDTGKSGTFQDFLSGRDRDHYPLLSDYAFDVQVTPISQDWIDNAELVRAGNGALYRGREMVAISLLGATGFHTVSEEKDGQTYERQMPNDSRHYLFACVHDAASDSFLFDLPGLYEGTAFEGDPELHDLDQWTICRIESPGWTARNTQLSIVGVDEAPYNARVTGIPCNVNCMGGIMISALLDDAEANENCAEHTILYSMMTYYIVTLNTLTNTVWDTWSYANVDYYSYVPAAVPNGVEITQVKNRDKQPTASRSTAQRTATYYYLTTQNAAGGERRLIRSDYGNSPQAEIDQGDIVFYDVLWDRNIRNKADVFYLVREKKAADGGSGEGQSAEAAVYHLKTAEEVFSPKPTNKSHLMLDINRTDLDVTVPTDTFSLQYMGDTVYLYWMELAGGDNAAEQTTYRLRGLVFDPDTRSSTDDFVLAQFTTANREDSPVDMFLNADGMAYYTVKHGAGQNGQPAQATVYAYRHGLKAHADLRCLGAADNLVYAGSDADVYITMTNDGSANINAVDLEIVLEDKDGNVIKDGSGKDVVIETLHMNLLNPEENTRVVTTADAPSTTRGEHAIFRVEELPGEQVQDRFNIEQVTVHWNDYTMYSFSSSVSDPVVTAVESMALLPGQTAGFKTAVHIPADWSGRVFLAVRLAENQNNGLHSAILGGYGEDKERLDHSVHDIDVNHWVYAGPRGEDYLHLSITNHAENGEQLRLYAEMFLDDDHTPIYVDLPNYPEYTAVGMVQNLDMPLSALLNGRRANVANVTIRAVGVEDRLASNNEFTLYLPEEYRDLMRISLSPADQIALVGGTATFFVAAAGGREPYTYQWQEYKGSSLGWQNVPGATEDTLQVTDLTLAMTGRQFRCVVTDHGLDEATSEAAALNVVTVLPDTGDHTHLPLYLALAAAAMLPAAAVRHARKKREKKAQ